MFSGGTNGVADYTTNRVDTDSHPIQDAPSSCLDRDTLPLRDGQLRAMKKNGCHLVRRPATAVREFTPTCTPTSNTATKTLMGQLKVSRTFDNFRKFVVVRSLGREARS